MKYIVILLSAFLVIAMPLGATRTMPVSCKPTTSIPVLYIKYPWHYVALTGNRARANEMLQHKLKYPALYEHKNGLYQQPTDIARTYCGDTPFHYYALGNQEPLGAIIDPLGGKQKMGTEEFSGFKWEFIDAANNEGFTPLHYAAYRGSMNTIPTFLSKGAAPQNVTTQMAYTPLHLAAMAGQPESAKALIAKYSNGSIAIDRSPAGNMPIHLAVENGDIQTVKVMLAQDKTVLNMRNLAGKTPLMLAAELGKIEIFNHIIAQYGNLIDQSIRSFDGKTAHDYARAKKHRAIVDWYDARRKKLRIAFDDLLNVPEGNVRLLLFKENGLHAMLAADPALMRESLDEQGNTMVHLLAKAASMHSRIALLARYYALMGIRLVDLYAGFQNNAGKTPIEYAREANNEQFLKAFGCGTVAIDAAMKNFHAVLKKRFAYAVRLQEKALGLYWGCVPFDLNFDVLSVLPSAAESENLSPEQAQEWARLYQCFAAISTEILDVVTNLSTEMDDTQKISEKMSSLQAALDKQGNPEYTLETIYTREIFKTTKDALASSYWNVLLGLRFLDIGHIKREFCGWMRAEFTKYIYDMAVFRWAQKDALYRTYLGDIRNRKKIVDSIKSKISDALVRLSQEKAILEMPARIDSLNKKGGIVQGSVQHDYCDAYPTSLGLPLYSFGAIKDAL